MRTRIKILVPDENPLFAVRDLEDGTVFQVTDSEDIYVRMQGDRVLRLSCMTLYTLESSPSTATRIFNTMKIEVN